MNDKPLVMDAFLNNEALFRGILLVHAANIEAHLAKLIAMYFCQSQERQDILVSEILMTKNFGLSSKIDLLKLILAGSEAKDLLMEKSLLADLNKVREFRNLATHSSLSAERADQRLGDEVIFSNFKKGNETRLKVSRTDQESWVALFEATHEKVLKLTSLLFSKSAVPPT